MRPIVRRLRTGLSPRVRGNRYVGDSGPCGEGSIPACAGEPEEHPMLLCVSPVYPRVCGGTAGAIAGVLAQSGSIPACAGEPPPSPPTADPSPVYPRVCGGTQNDPAALRAVPGLSPRVRGNLVADRHREPGEGSIPACAGEPAPAGSGQSPKGVYPRVCGEPVIHDARMQTLEVYPRVCGGTILGAHYEVGPIGLSPRVRGKPDEQVIVGGREQVYPRVCGGTATSGTGGCTTTGLSPRVRGNLAAFAGPLCHQRSIPACAGEPNTTPPYAPALGVYPRVCGGTSAGISPRTNETGLSPRVRGNRRRAAGITSEERSIPACAGEPSGLGCSPSRFRVYPRVCGGTSTSWPR